MGRTAKLAVAISAVLVVSVSAATPAPSVEPGIPELFWEITEVRCDGPDGVIEVDYRMWPEWGQISYLYLIVDRYGHHPDSYFDLDTGEFMFIAPAMTQVQSWRHEEWFTHGVDDPPVTEATGTAITSGAPTDYMIGATEFEDLWTITGDAAVFVPQSSGGGKNKKKDEDPKGTYVLEEPDYGEVWLCDPTVGTGEYIGLEAHPTWSWSS